MNEKNSERTKEGAVKGKAFLMDQNTLSPEAQGIYVAMLSGIWLPIPKHAQRILQRYHGTVVKSGAGE